MGPTRVVFRVFNQSKKVSRSDYHTKLDLEDAVCNPEYKVIFYKMPTISFRLFSRTTILIQLLALFLRFSHYWKKGR